MLDETETSLARPFYHTKLSSVCCIQFVMRRESDAAVIRAQTVLPVCQCEVHDAYKVTGLADLGYLGAALAISVSFWLQFFTLLLYILFLKVHPSSNQSSCAWSRGLRVVLS